MMKNREFFGRVLADGTLEINLLLGKAMEAQASTGLAPFKASWAIGQQQTSISRGVANQIFVGFRDGGQGVESESTAHVSYGLMNRKPERVDFWRSECVVDITDEPGLVVRVGVAQLNQGNLEVRDHEGLWRWVPEGDGPPE